MKRIIIISIITIALAHIKVVMATPPENVTFSGTISRHHLSNRDVEVSGNVHIRFGKASADGADSDVLVPFTIGENQLTTTYSQTVPWSLTSQLNASRRFTPAAFIVQISCNVGCSEANIYSAPGSLSSYTPNGETANLSQVIAPMYFLANEQKTIQTHRQSYTAA